MLSRRHIRIKVLQALYAYTQLDNGNPINGEKQLLNHFGKVCDLFVYQLSLLVEIRAFAEERMGEAKKKYYPTKEELNPIEKFIHNSFLVQLAENKDLEKKADALHINWKTESEIVRKLFNQIRETDTYIEYLADSDSSYKSDKLLIEKLFDDVIIPNETLHSYFEDINLNWTDDYFLVAQLVIMMMSSYKVSWGENRALPTLFKDELDEDGGQDLVFARDLFKKTIHYSDEFLEIIKPKIVNWEIDRVALMDLLILKMALVELTEMSSIPVKVTMNEYIEISKYFSTPKSKIFINGILDNLIIELKSSGRIKKTGRGLVE
ncbi:MAG: transcription antitermination protein NusB [Bacteroidales bacterium]|jgi:N utilization substance protein B|nr:transcription antitermination protein NusB [Bacteroidales bacterium]